MNCKTKKKKKKSLRLQLCPTPLFLKDKGAKGAKTVCAVVTKHLLSLYLLAAR